MIDRIYDRSYYYPSDIKSAISSRFIAIFVPVARTVISGVLRPVTGSGESGYWRHVPPGVGHPSFQRVRPHGVLSVWGIWLLDEWPFRVTCNLVDPDRCNFQPAFLRESIRCDEKLRIPKEKWKIPNNLFCKLCNSNRAIIVKRLCCQVKNFIS